MPGLEGAVLTVMSRIGRHRALYEKNEEAVKQHLIGEIMSALGWEWNNPEEVRPEERTEDGRADYALFLNGETVAFLEAKNLGVNILKRDEPLRQLARYCFSRGVNYGILSNGAVWIALKAFAEGTSLKDRVLFVVNLEEEPLERAVLKLSLLSKENLPRVEKLAILLKALEAAYNALISEGFSGDSLLRYLQARGPALVPVSALSGGEVVKALYIYEGGWRPVPLGDKTLKAVLFAVLDYLEARSEGRKAEEVRKVKKFLSGANIPEEKILALLKGIEEDEGLKLAVEL
ncbi:type I restriction endonuclease [Thermococcus stetteri]|uniref:type I restriction endonuclease n=1 Tax=Thermococcus stetteri TaxID=49900 RepID=UPI001AE163FE|nr:type I restriction endonuclease [Thermococcus stetteri]MBP1912878.1 putative type IV restriction endonuclease [Thermococcus stetteri]